MKNILIVFCVLLVAVSSLHEINIKHRERTPLQTKMFIAYMNQDPILENMAKVMGTLFGAEKIPELYTYPEEKIFNYLDTQYYGYHFYNLALSDWELLNNFSKSSSIPDHQTFGFLQRNAAQLDVFSTTDLTHPKAPPTSLTELTSKLSTDLEPL